jgi:hypothetical protein
MDKQSTKQQVQLRSFGVELDLKHYQCVLLIAATILVFISVQNSIYYKYTSSDSSSSTPQLNEKVKATMEFETAEFQSMYLPSPDPKQFIKNSEFNALGRCVSTVWRIIQSRFAQQAAQIAKWSIEFETVQDLAIISAIAPSFMNSIATAIAVVINDPICELKLKHPSGVNIKFFDMLKKPLLLAEGVYKMTNKSGHCQYRSDLNQASFGFTFASGDTKQFIYRLLQHDPLYLARSGLQLEAPPAVSDVVDDDDDHDDDGISSVAASTVLTTQNLSRSAKRRFRNAAEPSVFAAPAPPSSLKKAKPPQILVTSSSPLQAPSNTSVSPRTPLQVLESPNFRSSNSFGASSSAGSSGQASSASNASTVNFYLYPQSTVSDKITVRVGPFKFNAILRQPFFHPFFNITPATDDKSRSSDIVEVFGYCIDTDIMTWVSPVGSLYAARSVNLQLLKDCAQQFRDSEFTHSGCRYTPSPPAARSDASRPLLLTRFPVPIAADCSSLSFTYDPSNHYMFITFTTERTGPTSTSAISTGYQMTVAGAGSFTAAAMPTSKFVNTAGSVPASTFDPVGQPEVLDTSMIHFFTCSRFDALYPRLDARAADVD